MPASCVQGECAVNPTYMIGVPAEGELEHGHCRMSCGQCTPVIGSGESLPACVQDHAGKQAATLCLHRDARRAAALRRHKCWCCPLAPDLVLSSVQAGSCGSSVCAACRAAEGAERSARADRAPGAAAGGRHGVPIGRRLPRRCAQPLRPVQPRRSVALPTVIIF